MGCRNFSLSRLGGMYVDDTHDVGEDESCRGAFQDEDEDLKLGARARRPSMVFLSRFLR